MNQRLICSYTNIKDSYVFFLFEIKLDLEKIVRTKLNLSRLK